MEFKYGQIQDGRWLNVEEERQSGFTEIWIDGDLQATTYFKSLAFHLNVENVMKRATTQENVLSGRGGRNRRAMMQAQVNKLLGWQEIINSLQGLQINNLQGWQEIINREGAI